MEVTFETGKDIERHLDIRAPAPFRTFLEAMFKLGFTLSYAVCRADRTSGGPPFVPMLAFHPMSGPFYGSLVELDLYFRSKPGAVTVYAVVDGDEGAGAAPKSWDSKTVVRSTDESRVRDHLQSFIKRIVCPYTD